MPGEVRRPMNRANAISRLRTARVARLATVTADGRPHVVPFVFAVDEPPALRVYWVVDAKPKRSPRLQRLENIAHNPAVELVVDGYEEDWDRLWWVRVAGTARILDPGPEHERALAALRAKYPQHDTTPPPGPVVAIDVSTITGWEATSANG
jgi:PPOX class probable F420-dependent enzyme